MRKLDREALQRSIALARQEDEPRRQQIDHKLANENWEAVGRFASYCRQTHALSLRPWQWPPCHVTVDTQDDPAMGAKGGKRAAAVLLQRLLDNNLSRWEPDPLGALARIEAERAARA